MFKRHSQNTVDRPRLFTCASVGAGLLLLSWTLLLARLLRGRRRRWAADRRTAEARAAEVARLAAVRAPAIAERRRAGRALDDVPGPLSPAADTGEEFAADLALIVAALGSDEAVRRERELRDAVQAAFESVARHMHAMATVQQQVLDEVEQSIEDPRLMAGVMRADHAAAQMTRKAQTLLVMCGVWPARRESRPVSLYDCVRGAQSRIVEFGRVEVHGGRTLHVVPPAVEGVMHTIAELLENATVFSPSRTQVVVTVREVGSGAVVEIDDAGLGMPPDVLERAAARIRDELDLANLGAVPRLGLACVGRWTRELGFGVELSAASAYGGTRAVAFLPYRLLTEPLSHFSRGAGGRDAEAYRGGRSYGAAPDAPAGDGHEPDAHDGPGYGTGPYGTPDGARARVRRLPEPLPETRPEPRPEPLPRYRPEWSDPRPGAPSDAPYAPSDDVRYDVRYDVPYDPSDDPVRGPGPGPRAFPGEPVRPGAPYGSRPQQARSWGAPAPGPAGDGGDTRDTRAALPRRRSRRGAAVEAAAQQALGPRTEPVLQPAPQPPIPPAPEVPERTAVWTPEDARASVASVLSGTRRGRASVAGAQAEADAGDRERNRERAR
ncbi:ATP-binding protein, partial [Streptomyces sp. NPDC058953]|uniref:ATP-binding protein n=1 Tax=Streptomyces sp. NPDC058953 TaxID=3346676 RepID=UPI0036BC9AE6